MDSKDKFMFMPHRDKLCLFRLLYFIKCFLCQGGEGIAISLKTIAQRAFVWRPLTIPHTPLKRLLLCGGSRDF